MKSNFCLLKDECGYSIYHAVSRERIEKGAGQGRRELYKRIVELDAYQAARALLGTIAICDARLMSCIRTMGRYHGRIRANIDKIVADAISNYYSMIYWGR